ncbi:MAG TPA: hypothetical protein DCF46_02450, partial [Porphyromonadaceae bacterium]|nr:hypothetical protein [Porphyromonadaceae bacterium]HBF94860.1 hypothetical protein [Porphyromonadaceae bacterium]
MKFKSKHLFSLKITTIVLLSLIVAWIYLKGFIFSSAIILVAIVAVAVSMYLDRKKLISRMEQLIAGIRHSDFSTHFVSSGANDEINLLSQEMN